MSISIVSFQLSYLDVLRDSKTSQRMTVICNRLFHGQDCTVFLTIVFSYFCWLHRRGQDLKMPLDSYEWLSSSGDELSKLAKVMRNTVHLAVAISPLIVLQPRKLLQDNVRRDYLIAVSCSFTFPIVTIDVFFITACGFHGQPETKVAERHGKCIMVFSLQRSHRR